MWRSSVLEGERGKGEEEGERGEWALQRPLEIFSCSIASAECMNVASERSDWAVDHDIFNDFGSVHYPFRSVGYICEGGFYLSRVFVAILIEAIDCDYEYSVVDFVFDPFSRRRLGRKRYSRPLVSLNRESTIASCLGARWVVRCLLSTLTTSFF